MRIQSLSCFRLFSVFALGYLMRPVGGALIAHIGDRFERRGVLSFSGRAGRCVLPHQVGSAVAVEIAASDHIPSLGSWRAEHAADPTSGRHQPFGRRASGATRCLWCRRG
jgi:hypothetical protein